MAGISVIMQWYDVDDPTDDDGPIDDDASLPDHVNDFDNLLQGHNLTYGGTDATGKVRGLWEWTTFHPGNNIRIVAAPFRPAELAPIKPLKDDGLGRLFNDVNGDGFLTPPEPVLDESSFSENKPLTRMLTLWRKLHVEIDMMKGPDAQELQQIQETEDDEPPPMSGDAIRAPDTSLIGPAFAPASILVLPFSPNDTPETDDFQYHLIFNPFDPNASAIFGAPFRDSVPESPSYWTVYVQSAYEFAPELDNDPDTEEQVLGVTTPAEPEYSFIFLETIRDRIASTVEPPLDPLLTEKRVVAHEIGHHFLGEVHVDNSLMAQHSENATSEFTEDHIKQIRLIDKP